MSGDPKFVGNVTGGIDNDGEPFVMLSVRDKFGGGTVVMYSTVARELAGKLLGEARTADELAARMKGKPS